MAATRTHIITSRITAPTHRALTQIRATHGLSTSTIVNDALRTWLRTYHESGNLPASLREKDGSSTDDH